jgi:hypothetical protein
MAMINIFEDFLETSRMLSIVTPWGHYQSPFMQEGIPVHCQFPISSSHGVTMESMREVCSVTRSWWKPFLRSMSAKIE